MFKEKMKVVTDPTTGLPQLPKNHYWEVYEDGIFNNVSIRARKKFLKFFKITVAEDYVYSGWETIRHNETYKRSNLHEVLTHEEELLTPDNIYLSAASVLVVSNKMLETSETISRVHESFGKYPPNILKSSY